MKLKRYGPVLEPRGDVGAIFNCCTERHKGDIYLLSRFVRKGYTPKDTPIGHCREYVNYVSDICLAKSSNGKDFTLMDELAIRSDKPYDKYGCEDPRVSKLEGTYLIPYTALSDAEDLDKGCRIGLVSTKDFSKFEKHGLIGPDFMSKGGAFFPEKIDGKTVFIFKNSNHMNRIQIAYPDGDILKSSDWKKYWEGYDVDKNILLSGRDNSFEDRGVETGAAPIKTDQGWLLIYSAMSLKPCWSIAAALLDLNDPRKVIARSPSPILEPEMDYEITGDISDVVFPEGVIVKDDQLYVYYGAADKLCCLATCKLDELIGSLVRE